MDVGHESLKVFVVVVNRLEELEEALNDLHVALTEPFIKLDRGNGGLDPLIIDILLLQVVEAE